jgi:crotonobetainyl-CoA:carnitine CoA-transferase CaiB-like acyl-CoA transferase
MAVNGEAGRPPVRMGVAVGDLAAGLWGAIAALAGYVARLRNGRGRHHEVPLVDATVSMLSYMATAALHQGMDPERIGAAHHSFVPYGAYPTNDGWVVIAVIGDHLFPRLVRALDLAGLGGPDFATNSLRVERRATVDDAVALATATMSSDEVIGRLRAEDVPHAPVRGVLDALLSPYAVSRGFVATPEGSAPHQVVRGPLARSSVPFRAAPGLGEHTAEVLEELSQSGSGDQVPAT